jgi:GntR family transcriptional regulator
MRLRDEILSGQRPFGAQVPTEQEISSIYGVSRITSRRALDELAANKLVARKRRVGTHVIYKTASKPIEADVDKAIDSLVTWGRNTKATVLDLATEPASATVAAALRLQPGELVVRSVKLRWLDGEPLGYIESFLPARFGQIFTRRALKSAPTLTLLKDAGLTIGRATQVVGAASADATLAQALNVEMMTPLLRITRTIFDPNGEALLLTYAQYRADRYQVRLDLNPSQGDHRLSPEPELKPAKA